MTKEETRFATQVILDYLEEMLVPVEWSDEGSPAEGLQADIYGETQQSYILIEIEMAREDPVENVGKTIYEIEEGTMFEKQVRQIQIFSEFYRKTTDSKKRRQDTAIFIGEHFAEQFSCYEYHSLELGTTPSRESSNHLPDEPEPEPDRKRHAREVADEIPQILL